MYEAFSTYRTPLSHMETSCDAPTSSNSELTSSHLTKRPRTLWSFQSLRRCLQNPAKSKDFVIDGARSDPVPTGGNHPSRISKSRTSRDMQRKAGGDPSRGRSFPAWGHGPRTRGVEKILITAAQRQDKQAASLTKMEAPCGDTTTKNAK